MKAENTARSLAERDLGKEVVQPASQSTIINLVAHREKLVSLMRQSPEMQVSFDLYGISEIALTQLITRIGTSRAALWMDTGRPGRAPVLLRSHGIRKQWARAIGTACGLPILNHLRTEPAVRAASDLRSLVGPAPFRIIEQAGIVLFAPVTARGRVFGVLGLGRPDSGQDFDETDHRVLDAALGMLGVALDHTGMYNRLLEKHRQLEATNEALQEIDRVKSEFVSNVNHELKTPLTIILAYLDMLMEDEEPESARGQSLKTILDESRKLKALIEKLLDFGHVVDEKLEIELVSGDIVPLVRTCFEQRLPGVAGSLREFSLETGEDVPAARFDPVGVERILEVLVDNAVKFTPQGSQITLRVRGWQSGARLWVRIDVEDDGPGVPRDKLATIFESFSQGDGSTTRTYGGMGLGLAYAFRLADRMDGTLLVDEDDRQGALFSLLLPVAEPA